MFMVKGFNPRCPASAVVIARSRVFSFFDSATISVRNDRTRPSPATLTIPSETSQE